MDPTTERLAAAIAAHYRLERELGAGGMATVYLAEDLKHHRHVAIKVLRPDIAAAVGPGRFEDEIEIAAQLHHPHIIPVYDSGAVDGFLYYVMPQVEGESLRERLQKGDRIPTPDVVRILAEVADALAFAHAHGVVHRDIKPENVMMSGRHALVMDFGIAKAVREAGARRSSTSMGLAIGTPEYMSPEQAAGDPHLDHRTDVYSLGVLGYELLTGKPPFSGGGTEQILTRHITQAPAPIAETRPDVPPALVAVIMRALAKAPGERWQSAEDMRTQLEPLMTSTSGRMAATRLVGAAAHRPSRKLAGVAGAVVLALGGLAAWSFWGGTPKTTVLAEAPAVVTPPAGPAAVAGIPDFRLDPSIAVLPFENLSSDKEQAYFSDGISEELLNLLATVPKLRVIARSSSFQFRGKEVGVQDIARKLQVASVLEGSVRKAGNTVRITVQLVRASDGSNLWSETYDRQLDNVFQVQNEIAGHVVDKLKLTLLGDKPTARPVDPRVYAKLLQARELTRINSPGSRTQAIALYKQILETAPDEPRAWLGLARSYVNQSVFLELEPAKAYKLALAALDKAGALDPSSGQVHASRSVLALQIGGDMQTALREIQEALVLEPANVAVLNAASSTLAALGRSAEAYRTTQRLRQLDPANPLVLGNLQIYAYMLRECDDSIAWGRAALRANPDAQESHSLIGLCLIRQGHALQAVEEFKAEQSAQPRLAGLAMAFHALGRKAEAQAQLAQLEKDHPEDGVFYLATAQAQMGNLDAAFRALAQAQEQQDAALILAPSDFILDPLHKDPRWHELLVKMDRAPEQLAKYKFSMPALN